MNQPLFRVDRNEPLGLRRTPCAPPPGFDGLECSALEFSSRGDRVPAHLILPPSGEYSGARPLLLLVHGFGGSRRSDYLQVAARWVREGAAVATLDLPLHGDRQSPKMTERLLQAIDAALAAPDDRGAIDPVAQMLWTESARQALSDLGRLVDALESVDEVDTDPLVYVGFSLGGIIGALFAAVDPRPRAAALALAGGGFGPEEVDPVHFAGHIADCELLVVAGKRDARIPRVHTEALFEAAPEPKRIAWFDNGHDELPGVALKEIWGFARKHLGV